jgi:tRNA(His) 5'-end guanylyltransferase
MWDKKFYSIDNSYTSPSKINVTENKAPTDDSIRLMKEMEEKIIENIMDKIIVNDNSINIKAVIERDAMAWNNIVRIAYTINGDKRTIQTTLENNKFQTLDEAISEFSERFIKAISDDVADYITRRALNQIGEGLLKAIYSK